MLLIKWTLKALVSSKPLVKKLIMSFLDDEYFALQDWSENFYQFPDLCTSKQSFTNTVEDSITS